jgi:Tfp pilus assembly protein PilW
MKLQFRRNRAAKSVAMTLIELLIATGIGLMVMTAVATLMVFTLRSFVALSNYNDLDQASRNALDSMSRDIRQATNVSGLFTSASYIALRLNNNALQYIWVPNKLWRYKDGQAQPWTVVLEQCDYLRFGISQRNPSNNFSFYPAAGQTTAKLVDVSWTCSRQIMQQKVNTESVQTAKIVLRN